jgi:hypothetical protein
MKHIRFFMLVTWPILALLCIVSFTLGQSSVRRTTIVRSGVPYYDGVFYGECAWDGEPGRSRQFCATDITHDKNGLPLGLPLEPNPLRPMTRDDVICEPPNTIRLKPAPYTMASLEEMMQWCGLKIEAESGAR